MIAGIPGVGINGLFYLLLAALMPLRELPLALKGRSSFARWRFILGLLALAAGVSLVLWGEYWLIERAVTQTASRFPGATGLLKAMKAASPQWSVAPFAVLAAVVGSMHLLRLLLWLGGGRRALARRAGVLLALMAAPLVLTGETSTAAAASPVVAVYPPEGYDFGTAAPSIRAELDSMDDFYQAYFDAMVGTRADKSYGLAIANQILGIIRNDPAYIARAHALYAMQRDATQDAKQRKLAELGMRYTDQLLNDDYEPGIEPAPVEPVVYAKDPGPKGRFKTIVLGRSAIVVRHGALVKTQVDRVTRDWVLAQNPARVPWDFSLEDHVPWHEGEKNRELAELAGARIVPVWGMKASKIGQRWYAPDATGVLRFEISPDKIDNYPSTIVVDGHTAIVNDTHGISAIAWDALDADLVVGCGDHPGKMDAAYYLAEKGVNVYAPTDRFMGSLIGARTKGTILGTAPIRKTAEGAVIGAQPVRIRADEMIVVSTAAGRYPLQYYDTPKRYFDALAAYAGRPLDIRPVEVKAYGKAMNVVNEARKLGAKVLGIRVKSKEEHDAVAAWLEADRSHRAILFHTAVYPDGYRLFFEFPRQTSFGDIRPVFE